MPDEQLDSSSYKIYVTAFGIVTLTTLIRWSVSINSYSGYGKPPLYGDYEAQRHWMEITGNLPMNTWYKNTSDNNLLYWGLDYPPLTAYHSYLCGKITQLWNSSWNALHDSRGLENVNHKVYMRSTVLVCDLLIYIPLLLLFYYKNKCPTVDANFRAVSFAVFLSLLNPGLVLIDHGHFQYNSVSLGLTLWSVYAICCQRPFTASMLFCLALNYKQMELYHSVPFFVYLLKICCQQKNVPAKFFMLIKLGLVVVMTFIVVWSPFLLHFDMEGLLQILRRVFPFNRGLFEDKVGNVWCSLHPILRLKESVNQAGVVRLCLASTFLSIIPDCFLLWRSATPKNLIVALTSTSLSFFLFSYHVHEKSILLATAPASLLLLQHPRIIGWFITLATGSMFPLLHKDGLTLPTISLSILFILVLHILIDEISDDRPVLTLTDTILISPAVFVVVSMLSTLGMVLLCALHLVVVPPERFPDLFTYFIAAYSCGHFLLFKLYLLMLMRNDGKQLKTKSE